MQVTGHQQGRTGQPVRLQRLLGDLGIVVRATLTPPPVHRHFQRDGLQRFRAAASASRAPSVLVPPPALDISTARTDGGSNCPQTSGSRPAQQRRRHPAWLPVQLHELMHMKVRNGSGNQRQQSYASDRCAPDPPIRPPAHCGSSRTSSPMIAGMYVSDVSPHGLEPPCSLAEAVARASRCLIQARRLSDRRAAC